MSINSIRRVVTDAERLGLSICRQPVNHLRFNDPQIIYKRKRSRKYCFSRYIVHLRKELAMRGSKCFIFTLRKVGSTLGVLFSTSRVVAGKGATSKEFSFEYFQNKILTTVWNAFPAQNRHFSMVVPLHSFNILLISLVYYNIVY